MKVPLEWLKEYVAIRLSPEALADRLTMTGLEVTGIARMEGGSVLDIEVTPNRADCLSILGVAREVAAITGQRVKLPSVQGSGLGVRGKSRKPRTPNPKPRTPLTIQIEDRKGCSRYIGRLIDGVRLGPSPGWMQRRLAACGIRPINNVVDITNYVLLEYGQPLHAFDADALVECAIRVRRAKPGERLKALDGQEHRLAPEQLVIADASRPVAIAGVIGGEDSAVTERTTRVLLESALFDPILVRRTARSLGLGTESSYRFERGVDPVGVASASARAAALLHELAGGTETAVVDVGTTPSARAAIPIEPARASRWLGRRVDPGEIRTTLARLGCRVASGGAETALRVIPPSSRLDLVRDVDLYEEIARMAGYDRLPATLPTVPITVTAGDEAAAYRRSQSVRCLAASLGLTEAITWSLVSETALAHCGFSPSTATRLANPLSQDHAFLRPSLLPGLLQALRRNLSHGAAGVSLYEIGNVTPAGTHEERAHLGIVVCGWWARGWRKGERSDFWVLKGLVQALLERLCRSTAGWRNAEAVWAQAGQGAAIELAGRPAGAAGQIARTVLQAWDIDEEAWFAELSLAALLGARRTATPVAAPGAFPPVKRDLSILVDEQRTFESVADVIRETAGVSGARIELIDRFTKGAQVPPGRYSLTFSIEYRDPDRTLTAAEADALHQRIKQALVDQCGATPR